MLLILICLLLSGSKRGAKYSHGRAAAAAQPVLPAGPLAGSGLPQPTAEERFQVQQDLAKLQREMDMVREKMEAKRRLIEAADDKEAEQYLISDPKKRGKNSLNVTFAIIICDMFHLLVVICYLFHCLVGICYMFPLFSRS